MVRTMTEIWLIEKDYIFFSACFYLCYINTSNGAKVSLEGYIVAWRYEEMLLFLRK